MSNREGLGQQQRLPAALAPHYFDVDELRTAQLLALTLDYADLVRFAQAGAASAAQPSWRGYFGTDETLVIADILSTRLHQTRSHFDTLLEHALAGRAVAGEPVLREQLPTWTLYGMLARLRGWSETLLAHGSPVGVDLGALAARVCANLAPELEAIAAHYQARAPWNERAELGQLVSEMAATLNLSGSGAAHEERVRATLKTWFNQLAQGIDMVQRAAAQRLAPSLKSGQHDPGVALLLAFVQLYRAAQHKLNRLTERHLDFYYGQVLRMQPHGAVGDSTYLVFQPSAAGTLVAIPSGTAFLAQYAREQPDLVFATGHAVVVGDARLRAAFTLFCERNGLSSPENALWESRHQQLMQYPTACRLNTLPVPEAEAVLDKTRILPMPLFGAPRAGAVSTPGATARIGFALASNVLLMREGERVVQVALQLGAQASAAGGSGATLAERLQRVGELMNGSSAEVNYKVLRRMFRLSVSGAGGWIAVPGYSADFIPAAQHPDRVDTLTLYFTLGRDAPAVVSYDAALHGEDYASACPLLRCELNSEGYLYPYGLLRDLPLVKAQLDVRVTGHRTLRLQNHIGPLATSAPFLPFGPLPAPGAYLIVGSAEAACKRVTSAELVLEWGALPNAVGGLRGYYEGYGEAFEDVQCSLSVLAEGRWQPGAPGTGADEARRPRHTLFPPQPAARRPSIAPIETVPLTPVLHRARVGAPVADLQDFQYTPSSKSGFFKLTLDGPEFAFGHRDYPYVLAETLTHNSRPGFRRRVRDLPNPPYTP
ncbi:MAG: hypothetical protein ACLGI6_20505, partial [Gammaproteobacteria bacterium]